MDVGAAVGKATKSVCLPQDSCSPPLPQLPLSSGETNSGYGRVALERKCIGQGVGLRLEAMATSGGVHSLRKPCGLSPLVSHLLWREDCHHLPLGSPVLKHQRL